MSRVENPKYFLGIGGLYVRTLMSCVGKDGRLTDRKDIVKADPYDWRRLMDRLTQRSPSSEPPQELAQNE